MKLNNKKWKFWTRNESYYLDKKWKLLSGQEMKVLDKKWKLLFGQGIEVSNIIIFDFLFSNNR